MASHYKFPAMYAFYLVLGNVGVIPENLVFATHAFIRILMHQLIVRGAIRASTCYLKKAFVLLNK